MLTAENREISTIVLRKIRDHLTAIEAGIQSYHADASKFEEIDESIRRTQVAKCATTILGSALLNRLLSFQEDVLESIATAGSELDGDTLALLNTMIVAANSYVDFQEATPTAASDVVGAVREPMVTSLMAYRRYRRLPESEDDRAISEFFRGASNSAARIDAASYVPGRVAMVDAGVDELEAESDDCWNTAEESAPDELSAELLEVFSEEAEDHINHIYAGLRQLKNDHENRACLQDIRRAAHTFKGAAGAVGLRELSKLSHRMEDLLDALYDGQTKVTPDHLGLLLETTDVLQDCLNDSGRTQSSAARIQFLYSAYQVFCGEADSPVDMTLAADDQVSQERAASDGQAASAGTEASSAKAGKAKPAARTLRVPSYRLDEVRNVVSELMINRSSLEQSTERLVACVDELEPVLDRLRTVCHQLETRYEVPALWTSMSESSSWMGTLDDRADRHEAHAEFDELELDRYTDFHLLSRSLAETTSDTGAVTNELRTLIGEFETLLAQQSRLTRDAQSRLLGIRMVPFGSIAARLQRVLREVADRQSKEVELVIEGEDTELDKTVLEELLDPLLHLLRNSVDHGVELADVRAANGKPELARVTISASHSGTQMVIDIRDDGKGLDTERIRAGIVQGGYLDASKVATLSPQELYYYIFMPGFSTAAEVSEISGRGVGMDIVRSNIEKLKGTIEVASKPGQGTSFSIRLPTTLVVTRALIAMTPNAAFAIPTQSVAKIRQVEAGRIEQQDAVTRVNIDGLEYDLLRLDSHLEITPVSNRSDGMLTVVIVRLGDREVALAFHKILSTRDIVVKPLGTHLGQIRGLLGVTVLGDGAVVPILDPATLATTDEPLIRMPNVASILKTECKDVTVMIVDDSVSVRRALTNLIQYADWSALAARDGVDALEIIGELKQPPDVVLLDVEMPRMDGYQLLEILRSKPEFQRVPIIMITSRAGEKHRRKAIELGATAYVVKPFQDEALRQLIQRHVAQSSCSP